MSSPLRRLGIAELAARIEPFTKIPAYFALLAPSDAVPALVDELVVELRALDTSAMAIRSCASAARLLHELPTFTSGILVIDARMLIDTDWQRLDRGRSDLPRDLTTVFVTTVDSFVALMRVAPNLASWFGGQAFEWDSDAGVVSEGERAERLRALRAWAGKTDEAVIAEAKQRALPLDPEYAEWLVLLGQADLIDDV